MCIAAQSIYVTRAPTYPPPPSSAPDPLSPPTMLVLHPHHSHYNIGNEQQHHQCQAGLPHRSHSQDHYAQAPSPAPHEVQHQHHSYQHKAQRTRSMPHRVYADTTLTRATSVASTASSATSNTSVSYASDPSVVQALEIARESPDGASDPTIGKILDSALGQIWAKVLAAPNTYVMTREEFSVFNYFQHRFTNNVTAVRARGRYWDHARG
ncbi:uncharacterized protein F5Z01DRAFT_636082 [Emericellopsis atlantica]|uniref:Uncharacterized protein n=1 Tax=Emericellopsis atlantica TaxID=2614577 RepID=A0A9P8CP87_9HYPO|nr:uncharacterized protein F5Z01DRAFT_636082 [Emericellopsis atlantica]KAG9254594.1 hypothetical protein F5Z01DRAFT_636082 [Emericellopsis atlantica]